MAGRLSKILHAKDFTGDTNGKAAVNCDATIHFKTACALDKMI